MEYGSIERENYVNAPPDVVFQTVSDPKHIKEWWPDSALYEVAEGANGEIRFGDLDSGGIAVQLTIVDVSPPNRFAFRWTHPVGEDASPGNSMLVTFELRPSGEGTLLRFTETGFAKWVGKPQSSRSSTANTCRDGTTSCRSSGPTRKVWHRRHEFDEPAQKGR